MKITRIIFFASFLAAFVGISQAQTTVAPFLTSNPQFFTTSGLPNSGGCVFTYAAGTTTPLATYSESTGTSLNSNPVALNSAGFATSGGIWLTSASYKFVVKTTGGSNCSTGSTITTSDGITWSTPLSTFAGLIATGDLTLQQSTAATSGANQSSNNLKIQGTYWTGVVSANDTWTLADILGAGSNPTSTLTLTHSGSSGAATFSVPGNETVGGTLGVTGASTLSGGGTLSGGFNITDTVHDGIQVVGNGTNTNIAAAMTAAGTTGAVMIPPAYAGTDAINNTNNIPLLDYRRNNSAIGIWSVLQPAFPVTNFPLGNDLALHCAGPADCHIRTRDLQVTSSTSTVAATPVTVTVASPTLYGVAQGGNPTDLFSTSASIILEPGTAAEESVATFSKASGTTLTFTPANNHTQPFKIRQQGVLFLDTPRGIRLSADPTSQQTLFPFKDGNATLLWNFVLSGAGHAQQVDTFTGGNGANKDYVLINNNAASIFRWLNAANTRLVFSVDDNGNARNLSSLGLNGSVSGTSLISPPSTGGVTNTLPLSAGTLLPVVGNTQERTESAADTNLLTFTPPATIGKYRINFALDVSAANVAVLGWTVTYKDANGNAVAPTNVALFQMGAAAPALTFTTSAVSNYYGSMDVTTDASGTAIVVKFTLTSGTITSKASATVERLF